ncbi:MAG TPA: DUF454 domain-containing protein [Gemmatimonadetes bacterium]|nr:DUF454 domain-containing protein [Gemmatimonadota bacterium]
MEQEVIVTRSLIVRSIFVVLGLVFLGVGILGYFLPGLPGTIFLIIAAWFFSMSNPRLYRWMMTNRWFGKTLSDYRAGRGIPIRIKFIAVTAITISVTISVVFAVNDFWFRVGLIAIGIYGAYFVVSRPTTERVILSSR